MSPQQSKRIGVLLGGLLISVLLGCGSELDRWGQAVQADTASAYESYLAKYPEGAHHVEASQRLEERAWGDAQAADDVQLLERFQKQYPQSKYAAAARQAIDGFPKTALQRAVKKGDLRAVRALLDKGSDVNSIAGIGVASLHIAADACRDDMVDLLIASKADVNRRARDDSTPLHRAACSGCLSTVGRLLDAGADPNIQVRPTMQGYVATGQGVLTYFGGGRRSTLGSALHWAAACERTDIASLLIERGADVNAMTPRAISPVHYAAEVGSQPLVQLLLSKGAKARYKPDPEAYWNLAEDGVAIVSNGQPIHYAKTAAIADLLVAQGANINEPSAYRGRPIHSVAALGYADAVSFHLSKGVPVDTVASWNLDAGNTAKVTPLWVAAFSGQLDVLKLLEQRGGNLKFVPNGGHGDDYGGSLLHAAAMHGNAEVMTYLLTKGLPTEARADMPTIFPLAAPWKKVTPLEVAAHNGHVDAMAALLGAGANINAASEGDWSPIKLAIVGRQLEAVSYLLAHGATLPHTASNIADIDTSDEIKTLLRQDLAKKTP